MLDADRPIQYSHQDRLGRTVFSKYLARCILDHTNQSSLSIGLYGGWGAGKTSIINLTIEELNFAANHMYDDQKPIIFKFDAWEYSEQNSLIINFFGRLLKEVLNAEHFSNSAKISELIKLYIESFFPKYYVQDSVITASQHHTTSWLKKSFNLLRKKNVSDWDTVHDINRRKMVLNDALAKQDHKIIIFIDNIARLAVNEINQIFQILQALGDLSNTVYVLAFDKQPIVNAINELHLGEGENYLDKLVHLSFEIPPIAKQEVESLLIDRLNFIFKLVPEGSWDKNYWCEVYYSTLRFFFNKIQDITRFFNILSFSYIHVKDVVNPVDFFAITALELFEPQVYLGIKDNKDLFIDLAENIYIMDAQKLEEDKVRCDEVIGRAQWVPKEILTQLLLRLFPRLRRFYQVNMHFYHSEEVARKNKRICSYDLFEVYFRLSMGINAISPHEMRTILSLVNDESGFALALLRLNQDNRIPQFLNELDSLYVYQIPAKHIANVLKALLDGGDLFPQGNSTPFSINTPMRLHRIFHQLLQRLPDQKERFQLFHQAIATSVNSLYIIIYEIQEQSKTHLKNEDTYVSSEEHDFNSEQIIELQQLAVDKILNWADKDRLIEHPQFIPILYAWKDWGKDNQYLRYVEHVIQSDRGLLALLYDALRIPVTEAITKEQINPEWKKYLVNIENFISLDKIIPNAKELFQNDYFYKLSETDQLTLMIFLDLVQPNTIKVFPKTTV